MPNDQRSRNWCFTYNNYTEDVFTTIKGHAQDACKYAIIGKEKGELGTPHLQGYLCYRNAKTFDQVKKKLGPGAHLERAKGTANDSRNYCSKDGDFWETGELPEKSGGDSLLEKIKKNKRLLDETIPLDTLIEDGTLSAYSYLLIKRTRMERAINADPYTPEDVRGLWIWGDPGTGKTRHVWATYPGLYEKAQNKWFDGYTGEETILLDDLDTNILGHYLKRWMDRYPVKGEVKGGTIQLQHKLFVVTSNYSIEQLFNDPILAAAVRRRCKVIHFASLQ